MGWVFFQAAHTRKDCNNEGRPISLSLSNPEAVIYFRNGDHTYEFSFSHMKRTQIATEVIGIRLSFEWNLQC